MCNRGQVSNMPVGCPSGLAVAFLITDHYHPCLNLGMGISEGCFVFGFASLPLEVTRPMWTVVAVKHQSSSSSNMPVISLLLNMLKCGNIWMPRTLTSVHYPVILISPQKTPNLIVFFNDINIARWFPLLNYPVKFFNSYKLDWTFCGNE